MPFPNPIIISGAALGIAGIAVLGTCLTIRWRRLRTQRTISDEIHGRQDCIQGAFLPERRDSPRPWGPPVEVKVSDRLLSTRPRTGWVVNRSQTGVCLSFAEPIPLGTVLSIRASMAPESVPWTHVEVKHCEFKVNRWLIGGQFLEPIPQEVLCLFGYGG
jgi:hypothetical protein